MRSSFLTKFSVLAGLLLYLGNASEKISAGAIDPIEELRKKHNLPGLMAGYFTKEGEFVLKVSGVRKAGTNDHLQADDPMHIGSCTKSMTATLIGLLVDEGKLRWDSSLGEIFPEDEIIQKSPYAKATVEQLMNHTSGVPANLDDLRHVNPLHSSSPVHWQTLPVVEQRRRLVTFLAQQPLARKSPSYYYSNVGYIILGSIIEKIRGHSWEVEVQQKIFEPLKIRSAGFGPPSKLQASAPFGHSRIGSLLVDTEHDNPQISGPAGTLHMSMGDWVKYLRLHLLPDKDLDGFVNANDLDPFIHIRWKTLRHLHSPKQGTDYVGGWLVTERSWAGGRVLNHSGSNTYWYCVVWLAPLQNRGFIAASNFGLDAAKACDEAIYWMTQQYPPLKN